MNLPQYNFIIVSYYTENTPYEKEAIDLIRSCQKFGLSYDIDAVPNLGSWSKNCCFKPKFLLHLLEKHPCPLVWTDIDSVFVAPPTFFTTCSGDIALRINHDLPKEAKSHVLSGTLFINNTESTKRLLTLWDKACIEGIKQNPLFFDQAALNQVLNTFPFNITELPPNYLSIADRPEKDPIIIHYQASRLYQKILDQELSSSLTDALSSFELKNLRVDL